LIQEIEKKKGKAAELITIISSVPMLIE